MRRVLAYVFVSLCLLLLSPAALVFGHAELKSATPGQGDIIENAPRELVARFTQDLREDRTSLELRDRAGNTVARGGTDPERPRVQRMELPELEPGRYEVRWVSFSAEDDELARGRYRFVVAEPAAAPSADPSPAPDPSEAAEAVAKLPVFTSSEDDPAVGLLAPEIQGASFDGTPTEIRADGNAKLIVFLAHWCPHCQREVPEVQEWLDGGGLPEGVDLISVATANDPSRPNYPPDEWLEREGWTAPVIVDDDLQALERYGLNAFPFWVFVDGDGRVTERAAGRLSITELERVARSLADSAGDADSVDAPASAEPSQ